MSWEISLHPEVESWYLGICATDPATADLIEDAIDQLAREGPTAGRPSSTESTAADTTTWRNLDRLRPAPAR